MRPFDGLHVKVENVGLVRVGSNRGISAVRQRAGLSVAEPCDIVLVAAKVCLLLIVRRPYLECAEILVDILPNNLVGSHGGWRSRCGDVSVLKVAEEAGWMLKRLKALPSEEKKWYR